MIYQGSDKGSWTVVYEGQVEYASTLAQANDILWAMMTGSSR